MVTRLPFPGSESSSMLPFIRLIFVRTTSMPTPRPDKSLTWSAVLKPGKKIIFIIFSVSHRGHISFLSPSHVQVPWLLSLFHRQSPTIVFHSNHDAIAFLRGCKTNIAFRRFPFSLTIRSQFKSMIPSHCAPDEPMDLQAHLQRICQLRFLRRSVPSRTCLPNLFETSRTNLGNRANTFRIGTILVFITANWRSEVTKFNCARVTPSSRTSGSFSYCSSKQKPNFIKRFRPKTNSPHQIHHMI